MSKDIPNTLEPGIYDIPEDVYHAGTFCKERSLSASMAIQLIDECPARVEHERLHPPAPKDHYDFGSVAHKLVLGRGGAVAEIPYDDYRSKDAKTMRDEAREKGLIPIKTADYEVAQAMHRALLEHPVGRNAFRNGTPERTIVWRDEESGVLCRARLDWLPNAGAIFPDYKTTASAKLDELRRAMWNYNYFQRAAHYVDGIRALGLHDDPIYLPVFQEKTAPYLVVPVQISEVALQWGEVVNRRARYVFRRCVDAGYWPGYTDDIEMIGLPGYAEAQLQRDHEMGRFSLTDEWQAPLEQDDEPAPPAPVAAAPERPADWNESKPAF